MGVIEVELFQLTEHKPNARPRVYHLMTKAELKLILLELKPQSVSYKNRGVVAMVGTTYYEITGPAGEADMYDVFYLWHMVWKKELKTDA